MKYFGFVEDRLKVMKTRRTKGYKCYYDAHKAAEKLCKRTMGDRGTIGVKVVNGFGWSCSKVAEGCELLCAMMR
jgi:hypothetical protein